MAADFVFCPAPRRPPRYSAREHYNSLMMDRAIRRIEILQQIST
jgi:hypothetical protein